MADSADSDIADDSSERTPEEEILGELWRQLLNVRQVRLRDNFFDLGGHSLLATQLLSRIEQAFAVELPLRVLFEAPTLEQLAQRVTSERDRLDQDELEALLQSLEHLSDQEANEQLLAARPPVGETND